MADHLVLYNMMFSVIFRFRGMSVHMIIETLS